MSTVAGGTATRGAELAISGMTCASCAARIEKKLNKLDGVTATVNFATETAQVAFPATTGEVLRLAGAVEDASEHPVAAAIAAGARDRLGGDLPAVESFANAQGLGVSGVVGVHAVAAGRAGWLETEWAWRIPAGLTAPAGAAEAATDRTRVRWPRPTLPAVEGLGARRRSARRSRSSRPARRRAGRVRQG